jgi:hypothetical protein
MGPRPYVTPFFPSQPQVYLNLIYTLLSAHTFFITMLSPFRSPSVLFEDSRSLLEIDLTLLNKSQFQDCGITITWFDSMIT